MEVPRNLNLFTLPKLGPGVTRGVDIAYNAKAGNQIQIPPPPKGYDGYRLIGSGHEGPNRTTIVNPRANASLMIGRGAKVVELIDCEVLPGDQRTVYVGADSANRKTHVPLTFIARNFVFDGRGTTGLWTGFSDASDIWLNGGKLYGRSDGGGQHPWYVHGHGRYGTRWDWVEAGTCAGEISKETARPWGQPLPSAGPLGYYTDAAVQARASHAQNNSKRGQFHPVGTPTARPKVVRHNCHFSNWGLARKTSEPSGYLKGAAITIQGAAVDVDINHCVAINNPANRLGLLLGIDDSGVEHFGLGPDGGWAAGQLTPANGKIQLRDTLCWVGPGPSRTVPMIDVNNLAPNFHRPPLYEELIIERCGLYGENRTIKVPHGAARVQGCNSPQIYKWAQQLGVDTTHEPQLHSSKGLTPLQQGLILP